MIQKPTNINNYIHMAEGLREKAADALNGFVDDLVTRPPTSIIFDAARTGLIRGVGKIGTMAEPVVTRGLTTAATVAERLDDATTELIFNPFEPILQARLQIHDAIQRFQEQHPEEIANLKVLTENAAEIIKAMPELAAATPKTIVRLARVLIEEALDKAAEVRDEIMEKGFLRYMEEADEEVT